MGDRGGRRERRKQVDRTGDRIAAALALELGFGSDHVRVSISAPPLVR
jgi:hypothetical protein